MISPRDEVEGIVSIQQSLKKTKRVERLNQNSSMMESEIADFDEGAPSHTLN